MKKMTKQTRIIIYSSIFIAGFLVFSAVLYFISSKAKVGGIETWVTLALIAAAAISVGIVVYARKRIKRTARLLDKEYFEAYELIADSFQGSVLGTLEKKETLNDILGLFIDAMNSGRKVEQVTGGDIDGFIRKVKESFGYRNGLLFGFLSGCQYAIIYLLFIQVYEWLRNSRSDSFFNANPGYSSLVILMPIALIGLPLMRYFIMKQKIVIAMVIPLAIFAADVAFMEITYANFMHIGFIKTLHEGDLSLVPGIGFLILWLALLAITYLVKWLLRKSSIRKM